MHISPKNSCFSIFYANKSAGVLRHLWRLNSYANGDSKPERARLLIFDHFPFDEPFQICCDVLSPLFREHTARRVQGGIKARWWCMLYGDKQSARPSTRHEVTERLLLMPSMKQRFSGSFFYFSHRSKSIFSISLTGTWLMSHDAVTRRPLEGSQHWIYIFGSPIKADVFNFKEAVFASSLIGPDSAATCSDWLVVCSRLLPLGGEEEYPPWTWTKK